MADSEEQLVSSTTTSLLDQNQDQMDQDQEDHYRAELDRARQDRAKQDLFSLDDIVDLVGGAQDALERHMAQDGAPHEPITVLEDPQPEPQPQPEPEPVLVPEIPDSTSPPPPAPEPETLTAEQPQPVAPAFLVEPPAEPEPEPEPEPEAAAPAPEKQPEPEPEPEPLAPVAPVAPAAPAPEAAPPAPESTALPAAAPAPHGPAAAPASVVELLYWRDVKASGVVFGAALLLLLSLTVCSIVSVLSYVGLALLSVTVCFRIYKGILQAIQKSDEGHPFKQFLDQEVALSEDLVHQYSDLVLARLNKTVVELRRLFLVQDLVDSIKFAVLMWILTYVGALFNGLTLLILGVIGVFSCPIVYEKHQAQIDHYVSLVNNQVKDVVGKIQAKVPGMKKKSE